MKRFAKLYPFPLYSSDRARPLILYQVSRRVVLKNLHPGGKAMYSGRQDKFCNSVMKTRKNNGCLSYSTKILICDTSITMEADLTNTNEERLLQANKDFCPHRDSASVTVTGSDVDIRQVQQNLPVLISLSSPSSTGSPQ